MANLNRSPPDSSDKTKLALSLSESVAVIVIVVAAPAVKAIVPDELSVSDGVALTTATLYQPLPFEMYILEFSVTYACWPVVKLVTGNESSVENTDIPDADFITRTAAESIVEVVEGRKAFKLELVLRVSSKNFVMSRTLLIISSLVFLCRLRRPSYIV